jgi:hypothetical protein
MNFNDRRKKDKGSFFRGVSKKNPTLVTADVKHPDANKSITKMGKALGWSEASSGVSFKDGNNTYFRGPEAGPQQPVVGGYSRKNVKVVKPQPKGAQRTYNKVGK